MSIASTNWLKTPPRNLIVRMPDHTSDFVMATSVLTDLRRHFPNATLTAMCQALHAPLLDQNPVINELFPFQLKSGWVHHYAAPDIIDNLRLGHYDLGLLLTTSLSSAWWFWRGKVRNRIGYAKQGRSVLLSYPVPYPKEKVDHPSLLYKQLLVPLGIELSNTPSSLFVSKQRLESAKSLLTQYGWDGKSPLIGIHPTTTYGNSSKWPLRNFRSLSEKLLNETNAYLVYLGDLNAEPLLRDMTQYLPARVLNLAGKSSLSEWVALIAACNLLIADDNAPLQVAAAVETFPIPLFEQGVSQPTCTSKEISVEKIFSDVVAVLNHTSLG